MEFAILKPWDERGPDQNASKLVAEVRNKLLQILEAFALSFDPPSILGPRHHRWPSSRSGGSVGPRQCGAERCHAVASRRGAQAAGAQPAAAVLVLLDLDAAVHTTTSTAARRSFSASTCRTSCPRCRSISARSTSTTSACSAAPSG
ncbi:hypothetical protein ACVOMV_20595 [Mesorhizobium atlanticum]